MPKSYISKSLGHSRLTFYDLLQYLHAFLGMLMRGTPVCAKAFLARPCIIARIFSDNSSTIPPKNAIETLLSQKEGDTTSHTTMGNPPLQNPAEDPTTKVLVDFQDAFAQQGHQSFESSSQSISLISFDDSSSHESDYSYLSPTGFHELYLQRAGSEYQMPIFFEDGMDIVECDLYYELMESQETGGRVKRAFSGTGGVRNSCVRDHGRLPMHTCLRKSRRVNPPDEGTTATATTAKNEYAAATNRKTLRRCSFSGIPRVVTKSERWTTPRSTSSMNLVDHRPSVSFKPTIKVITIHSAMDYSADTKAQLWMSKKEMRNTMQMAMIDRMRGEFAQQQQDADDATHESVDADGLMDECCEEEMGGPPSVSSSTSTVISSS